MGRTNKNTGLVGLTLLMLVGGCAGRTLMPESIGTIVQERELPQMTYCVQAGAFLNLDNAIRLTEALEGRGIPAYYFRDETGFYKVRFGDFGSREAARDQAEGFVASGIIHAYYIVEPGDYDLAKGRIYGRSLRIRIVKAAQNFVGLPYRWGGSSSDEGFDCSGLAMAVYHLNGINLPRSSREQYMTGRPVERTEVGKGDLVFFTGPWRKRVSHVGVYAGNGNFIHAPGRGKTIRVNSLSDTYYETHYVGARSYLR